MQITPYCAPGPGIIIASLHSALEIIKKFIILESVLIGKSLTFVPFIPQVWGVVTHMPLQWVEEITYLGVQEQGRFVAYLEDNINFLLSQFACKYQA